MIKKRKSQGCPLTTKQKKSAATKKAQKTKKEKKDKFEKKYTMNEKLNVKIAVIDRKDIIEKIKKII